MPHSLDLTKNSDFLNDGSDKFITFFFLVHIITNPNPGYFLLFVLDLQEKYVVTQP